uniref:Uncharacterized protein n=1 Tax=Onchocerca volvulus TaxID=6282 RepID=A0A8R1U0A0_ONCVO
MLMTLLFIENDMLHLAMCCNQRWSQNSLLKEDKIHVQQVKLRSILLPEYPVGLCKMTTVKKVMAVDKDERI